MDRCSVEDINTQLNNKKEYLPIAYTELTTKFQRKAEKELHENEENKIKCLRELKKLIEKENISCCKQDEFLLMFLRSKKYNLHRSLQQLKSYSHQRHVMMEYHDVVSFETIKKVIEYGICGLLPRRDDEGRALLYVRASQLSANNCDPDDVFRAIQMISHFALHFPITQVSGICFISDAYIPSFEVFRFLFKYVRIFAPKMHVFPARFKRIDFINVNVLFRTCFNLLIPVIPSKLLRRIKFHGDEKEDLLKIYPPEILPEEFGGNLGSINSITNDWIAELETFYQIFQASNDYYK